MIKRTMNVLRLGVLCCGAMLGLLVPAHGQLVFDDVASATGTTSPSFGRAGAMVDMDGDGLLDLVTANDGMDNDFQRQLPDHTFEQVTSTWGIAPDSRSSWGVLVTDFDNDADSDVYFINGGSSFDAEPNQYLRNDLATLGLFSDLPAGAASQLSTDFGGTSLDYDRDGDLDIFVTTTWDSFACYMLENDGTAEFTDVSLSAGITHADHFRHCTTGDIDNDGWFDVAVGGPLENLVYRNLGDSTFEEVGAEVGLNLPLSDSFGLVLDDFNNDGWVDAFNPRYQLVEVDGPSLILLNDGTGHFIDVTTGSGLLGQADMGHTSGDLDADGFPDIYIGTGGPHVEQFDVLFRILPNGVGGLTAIDVSASSGILSGGPTRCHGMPIGDFDEDGFQDIYVNNGGPDGLPMTLEENFLWRNRGNANNWTSLRLTGVISNRSAVGTRGMARADTGKLVSRTLRAGHGFANTDSPLLHFGMGETRSVEQIDLFWPSGIQQSLLTPPNEQVTDVIETGMRLAGHPAIGSQVTFDLAGPAGFQAEIFMSRSAASTPLPLPEFGGILRLGPPIQPYATGLLLDRQGKAARHANIPADPSLVGGKLYFQAWIHPVGELTNSTLSGLVTLLIE